MVSLPQSLKSATLAAALLAFYRIGAEAAGSTCYWPDGSIGTGLFVCSPQDAQSACCANSDYCTTTGYCISSSVAYHYRSACTDETFASSSCPQGCLAGSSTNNHTFVNIIACDDRNGSWCCTYDGPCCNDIWQYPPLGQLLLSQVLVTTTISASGTATASAVSEATMYATATAVATVTACASSDNSAAIGAGVGVPLGVLALVACAYAIWLHRKSKRNGADFGYPPEMTGQWGQQGNIDQPEGTKFVQPHMPTPVHELAIPNVVYEVPGENRDR